MYGTVHSTSSSKASSAGIICACAAFFAVVGFVSAQPTSFYAPAAVRPALQTPVATLPQLRAVQPIAYEASQDSVEVQNLNMAKESVSFSPLTVGVGAVAAFFAAFAAALFQKKEQHMAIFAASGSKPEEQSLEVVETAHLQGSRRQVLAGGVAGIATATALSIDAQPASAGLFGGGEEPADWEQVFIPDISGQDFTFYDVTMLDDKRGFLVGSRQIFLETNDGGKTWVQRSIDTQDDLPYRLTSISFNGDEGWMVGKPPILLHTTNAGKDWERIGLSANLPGIPILIKAGTEKGTAEMCTDQGGIYVTTNTAQTWKAAVEETVDATLNRTVSSGISGASYYTGTFGTVSRNDDGKYIGVSSRGNFYMTWEPGQTFWMPHNRSGARRIQAMGWRPDGGKWEISRGGQLAFARGTIGEEKEEDFEQLKLNSRGYGLLDVAWRTDNEVWTVGGSGTLIKSLDNGQKWNRQRSLDDVAANLYEVRFFNNGKIGFVLGNSGVLLRYVSK